ncbi:MAG TPA: glycosyltransferase family 2 protein [Candidatus Deferrimicrobiaceae bacterium]|nr:glycosyltransferase family 2 protein [Candidatus Deferrimicrobiaceae bacterium]
MSIVIPAYNEAEGIRRTVDVIRQTLGRCDVDYEIIVVDDGSRDGTYTEIRRMAEGSKGIRGIRLSRNFGKEAAILAGLQAARGNAVITIDADLQHPPRLIPEMIRKWRAGARIVHGVKRERAGDSVLVRGRAAVFNRILTLLGGIDMHNASDFKLLDRVAVDAVVSQLKEKRRFYRGLVQWVGFEQETLPFDVEVRKAGRGKWSLRELVAMSIMAVVSFTSTPLRIVTILGVFTLCFAFAVTVETLWSVHQGRAVSGFATLEITILLIGSFIMISLGIVGEYLAKIYDETKARPPYIVGSRCGFDEGNEPRHRP